MSLLLFDEVESKSGKFDLELQSTRQWNADSSVYFADQLSDMLQLVVEIGITQAMKLL